MFEEEYKATFTRVRASGETYRRVMQMGKGKETAQVGWKNCRVAILAALMALILSSCAAKAIMGTDNWIHKFFSEGTEEGEELIMTENQKKILEEGLVNVGQCATSNGYTVTLISAITDGYMAYMKFQVDAPEETVLAGEHYQFKEMPTEIFGEKTSDAEHTGLGGSWEKLDDEDPNDNRLLLLLKMHIQNPEWLTKSFLENNTEYTIELNTLERFDEAEKCMEMVAEGEWRFTFSFGENTIMEDEVEILSKPVRCNGYLFKHTIQFDVSVNMTSFKLRSMGATAFYDDPWYCSGMEINLESPYVVLKDGTKVEAGVRTQSNRDGSVEVTFVLDMPISLEDVDYVDFPGGRKVDVDIE